jgi:anti-anti-sigma factor
MSHVGRAYFGFDLPAVIDVLAPAVEKIIGSDEAIRYAAVDATNYKTLEAPLTGTTAPLVITTEGLLMYFTQPELEEVFTNIHKLLQKHGGSWFLVDRSYHQNDQRIAEAMLNDDRQALDMFKALGARGAGTMADIKTYNNSFFTGSDEEVRTFIKRMGFKLREIPMADYLPERIVSLEKMPQVEPAVRDVFKTMYFWELTVSKGTDKKEKANLPFALETSFEDGRFCVAIQGRMDTLTAPELLQKFQQLPDKATAIEIDIENMSYVSSAGLRVLLMMYKSVEDKSRFKLLNVSDEVREILEVTGFDQFLLT